MPNDSLRPYLWLLCGCFCFSWMGTCAHWTKSYFPWQGAAVVRSLVPLVLVACWAWAAGVRFVVYKPGILWMRSIAGSLSLVATFYAMSRLPVSEVFTLTNMFPIWVALLSWPMLGEVPGVKVWIAALLGIAGVIVMNWSRFDEGLNPATFAALSASFSTAFAMIGLNRLKGIDSRAVVVHFSAVSLIFSLLACLLFPVDSAPAEPTGWSWGVLFLIGLMATCGQMFLTTAFTTGDAAKLSVTNLMQVVLTFVWDITILGNMPDRSKWFGIPLILGPTAWLMLSQPRKVREQTEIDEKKAIVLPE